MLQVGARCCSLFSGRLDSLQVVTLSRSTASTGLSLCAVKKMPQKHQVVQHMVSQLPMRAKDRRKPL